MHDFHDVGTVAQRVVLTPAERALLRDQFQNMQAELATLLGKADEPAAEIIAGYQRLAQHYDYALNILNTKLMHVINRDHQEGREH